MISISKSQDFSAHNHTEFIRILHPSHKHYLECIWSAIIWKDNYRSKANFLMCDSAVFDFDNGVWSLGDAVAFADSLHLGYLIGTTKSHQKEKRTDSGTVSPACDRFRLILAFERAIHTLSEYEYNMRMLMQLMPVDISCKDGARFFYPCKNIIAMGIGKSLPVLTCPPEETLEAKAERHRARMKKYAGCGSLPPWVIRALTKPIPEGERHLTAYKLGAFFFYFDEDEQTIYERCAKTNLADIGEDQLRRAIHNGHERAERES